MSLKLLIVEDEDLTRECLISYIPWKDLGINEIKEAKNGEKALEVINNFTPDILLTDIRMPKIDGIELSKRIKILLPKCKIIFISGYADKEYLLSAIHLNALDYIEKPINIDDITKTMKKVIDICKKEMIKEQMTNKIFEMFNENLTLIHKLIINELVKPLIDINTLEKYGFDLRKRYYSIAVYISTKNREVGEIFKDKDQTIENIINKCQLKPFEYFISFYEDNYILIVANNEITPEVIVNIIKNQLKLFDEDINTTFAIGSTINEIEKSGQEIKNLMNWLKTNMFYYGQNKIYSFVETNSNQKDKDFNNEIAIFEELLKNNQFIEAKKIISQITTTIQNLILPDIDKVKEVFLLLMFKIYEVGREKGLTIQLKEKEKENTWKSIDKIITLNHLEQYILDTIDEIFIIFSNRKKLDRKVYQIISYINEHFSDKDLSIIKMANYFYFSPNYLCNIFKKATGKTINDYITEVRIEKAKTFLKDRSIKLYEVAEMVGFGDANYFSSIFKKKVGVTPSVFKERFYHD